MKKTALVTGANKGIGLAIARELGQMGFHIFLTARSEDRGNAAVDMLRQEGISTDFVRMDVGDRLSIERALQSVRSKTQHLDVLINNAGILLDQSKGILDISEGEIRDTINVNALGVLFVTRAFAPLLKRGSRVVNVSSGAGKICGGMGQWAPVYSISKTTENAITIQLAYGLKEKGVLVNAVCPGWVRTDMGGAGASRSISKGAETPVWLATHKGLSQTGKFYRDKKEISW